MNQSEFHIDNSRRSTFTKCPFRYDLSYNRGITPVKGSTALRYGTVFHAMMEGFYSHIKENGWTRDGKAMEKAITMGQEAWAKESDNKSFYDDYRSLDSAIKSFILYMDHFAEDEKMLKVVNTERAFKIRLQPDLYFTGRLDMEMELSGHRWINEFKTTGREIPYIANQQNRDFQFVGYTYAMKKLYGNKAPEGILITYHQLSAYKSKKTGSYGEPKILFDRIPQFFSDQDLREWKMSMLYTASQILECKEMNVFPKNFDSCYIYGACPYLFLCEQKRPHGEENLAGEYKILQPWNVLDTVPEKSIVVID